MRPPEHYRYLDNFKRATKKRTYNYELDPGLWFGLFICMGIAGISFGFAFS